MGQKAHVRKREAVVRTYHGCQGEWLSLFSCITDTKKAKLEPRVTSNILKRILPRSIVNRICAALISQLADTQRHGLTIAEGWEQYARQYSQNNGQYIGDEWNEPDKMGIDIPANQILPYLDDVVFNPFLGNPEVILEIGSGGGRFTELLLPKCARLIATDTSPTMLKLLRQRFVDNPKIDYVLLDGLGLASVPNNSIDAAFSYGVFVHLQHWDIYNYLSELNRILKPGGKAIIQHANTFSELGWRRFLGEVAPSLNRHKLPGSFAVMTPEVIREFVQRAGLLLQDCLTDVVRRDCISLMRKPSC